MYTLIYMKQLILILWHYFKEICEDLLLMYDKTTAHIKELPLTEQNAIIVVLHLFHKQ